jgi:hypothetical protein
MRLQSFFERAERIAVAGGGGVLRDFQDLPNLGESEFVPDFQNHDLPLFVRQTLDRRGVHLRALVDGRELRLELRSAVESGDGFAAGATLFTAQAIERGRADGGVKERPVFDRVLAPPKADKRLLHDVLGFRPAIRPATRKKEQSRAELSETGLPIIFAPRILHFAFTIF